MSGLARRVSERIRKSFRRKQRPYVPTRAADTVDARPVKKGCIRCKIALLDGTDLTIDVEKKAKGEVLVKKVLLNLDLVEKDYFGLQFMDTKQVPHWLDPTKKVKKQVKIGPPYTLHFRVKFYAAAPENLHEELTRYHFFLQIKQDILRGKLKPTFDQMVGIGAYSVQSELGDFDHQLHSGNYVSEFRLVPDQSAQLEASIERRHKQLLGLNPADCELSFLKIAKKLGNYGLDFHTVQDKEGAYYDLGLCAEGIMVYKDNQKIAGYPWPKISNIAFHKKDFVLGFDKDSGTEEYRYVLTSARASKHLWKCAIEYHTFFRLTKVEEPVSRRGSFLKFGSRFRYSGRTLHQASKDDSVNARKSLKVKRTRSERYAQRSTIGYIRVGSNVWAKSFNGDYYRGQVTALADKVYIKFENGDTIAHDRSDTGSIVFDMDPNPSEVSAGTKVIAHWSGLAAMLPGVVDRQEGHKYFVLYDDGDKAYNTIQQIRILKPPLYFGPGSGASRIQKRLSMKATSLMGDGRTSSSGDDNLSPGGPNSRGMSVTADIAPETRKVTTRTDKTSVKSNKSDTSEVFFSKFDQIDSRAPVRRPENNGNQNSNGRMNGYDDYDNNKRDFSSGNQKWHTHVTRSEVVEEERRDRREENSNITHKYKIVERSTSSSSHQRSRVNHNTQPAFLTEL